jgi:hypothetical protein
MNKNRNFLKGDTLVVNIKRFGNGATFQAKGSGDLRDVSIMLTSVVIGFAKMAQDIEPELTDENTIEFLRDTFECAMQNFLEKKVIG